MMLFNIINTIVHIQTINNTFIKKLIRKLVLTVLAAQRRVETVLQPVLREWECSFVKQIPIKSLHNLG